MTVAEIRKFFNDNASDDEVKGLIGEFSRITPDKEKEIIDSFKKSSEFKKELQVEGDRRATGAVEKFRSETMPKHVEDEIKKRFPDETPEQKSIRELTSKLERIEQEKAMSGMREKTIKALTEKGLSPSFMDYIRFDDEGQIPGAIEKFSDLFKESVLKEAESRIRSSGSNPPKPNGTGASAGKITSRDELKNMKPEDIIKAQSEGRINIPGVNLDAIKTEA